MVQQNKKKFKYTEYKKNQALNLFQTHMIQGVATCSVYFFCLYVWLKACLLLLNLTTCTPFTQLPFTTQTEKAERYNCKG